jgi:hypothetical protein
MSKIHWLGLGVALSVGCVRSGNVRGYRLYERDEQPGGDVCTLIGDVESVDGKSVSGHGHRFELLSGCHTVTNVKTWGGADPNAAVMAHLPEIPFNIEMQAGLTYVLRIAIVGQVREGGRIAITAVEQDANGHVLRKFEPGASC